MKEWIRQVAEGRDLQAGEAADAMTCIMDGQATDAQIAALLMALRMKGETVEEIAAFARVMRARAVTLSLAGDELLDLCGTGGDGIGTINVSTLAALVAASEGVKVAKHGNRSVSSRCGSADLLEALGVRLDAPPEVLARCLEEAGICFLFAPSLNPAMAQAARARREMGVRTLFNLLGPLTNPAHVTRQLLGVFHPGWTEPLAGVLGLLGAQRALVVHGAGGMDEVSLSGPTRISELAGGEVRTYEVSPEDFELERADLQEVRGGDVGENVAVARRILDGDEGAPSRLVALNAGAALLAAGKVDRLATGVHRARKSLQAGRAGEVLERLCQVSNT
jgi:anthranilate phosphoribosyltransferase